YNVRRLAWSTDIFNYFTSLFGRPHTAIEDPTFLAPENIKALYAHDMMEPGLVEDLARRFQDTFEDRYTEQQWKGAYKVEEIIDNINTLYIMMRGEAIATYKLAEKQAAETFYCPPHFSNTIIEPQPVPCGQGMDNKNPKVVIIADPPITTTPAIGSEGVTQEEGVMEVVEAKTEKQPEVEKLTEQIKEMKEKIERLEKEKYGKAAIELAKQLKNANTDEEETSKEPFVEVVSEIVSEEDENPQANILPTPPVYAKAGGQNVENITNPEKFAKAHAYVTMKLRREFNARQEGLGNNFHAMYASCQSRAGGLAYTIAKAVVEDKKDPESNYTNIQVWKKETDNTDPCIRFWEVIDHKKTHDILEVGKNLKRKVAYRMKHAYNRSAASKVPKRWVKRYSDVHRRKKLETPEKDRKRKHRSC
uniref:Uncharacterized protein n=1 Tax=Romanomermis culicivorax TaxID=13658 RepID=A0A915JXZ0_ROMCU